MARSLSSILEAHVLEDYENQTTFHPPGPRKYGVEKTSRGVFHHEIWESADGRLIYDQSVPIHFSLGSGQRGRSFLTNRDGLLYMSSIGWYANGMRWDLSPGYWPDSHQRFERQVSDGCVMCHSGRMASIEKQPATFDATRPFLEESIGCERCHGPAASHVARHTQPDLHQLDRIVNPAKLDHQRQEAVCNQCHLQGTKRTLRYGRREFDFRPGDLLGDIWILSIEPEHSITTHDFRAVSQTQQMHESVCFQKSKKLGCISCHDPHRHPVPEDRHAFYDGRCLKCHTPPSSACVEVASARASKSCIECHMPRLSTSDVPHTSQTDHRILRSGIVAVQQNNSHSPEATGVQFYREEMTDLPDWELQRARGILISEQTQTSNNVAQAYQAVSLLRALQDRLPDDTDLLNALGVAYMQQDDFTTAAQCFKLSLKTAPKNARTLQFLAVLYQHTRDFEQSRTFYEQLIEVNPWRAEYFSRYSHVLAQLGDVEAAVKAGEKSVELDPTLARVHAWLANLYQQLGNVELAIKHRELSEMLSPK